ncbi:transcriptional regulator [Marinobacterium zhoushanense]|uniref:Transcriptional regulator n=1 Tax=Marinobacterium zhoushanense TaxID=1679163 RepID=A0ABQ1KVW4_9GAMM|nr:LysR family transcriptional regulator [Marinobacterium zhoushanense]GGC11058.1 transcriptional regulator [Marinobacterium zhoushanense]
MDRIEAMRTFITVADEGSFTRAAERLSISPQLVSKYVGQLERQLGARLLNRTTRKVHLTEAGARYCQRAQQLLDELDELDSQVSDMQTQAQGLLRISAPVSFSTRHLAPLLCAFQQANPAVGIDLQLSDRKVDIVDEGFDVTLRIGRLKSSSLVAKRIAPVRLVLCASPDYLARYGTPTHPEQLSEHHYLRYSYLESDPSLALSSWLRESSSNLVSNNGDVLVQAALQGAGIVMQPTFICGPAVAEGKLKVVLPEFEPEPMGLYAVYAHRQLMASKVRSFIDFVSDYFDDVPYWDRFE